MSNHVITFSIIYILFIVNEGNWVLKWYDLQFPTIENNTKTICEDSRVEFYQGTHQQITNLKNQDKTIQNSNLRHFTDFPIHCDLNNLIWYIVEEVTPTDFRPTTTIPLTISLCVYILYKTKKHERHVLSTLQHPKTITET